MCRQCMHRLLCCALVLQLRALLLLQAPAGVPRHQAVLRGVGAVRVRQRRAPREVLPHACEGGGRRRGLAVLPLLHLQLGARCLPAAQCARPCSGGYGRVRVGCTTLTSGPMCASVLWRLVAGEATECCVRRDCVSFRKQYCRLLFTAVLSDIENVVLAMLCSSWYTWTSISAKHLHGVYPKP